MRRSRVNIVILFFFLLTLGLPVHNGVLSKNVALAASKPQAPSKTFALAGQFSDLQFSAPSSEYDVERFNITLWVRDWKNETSFSNLNVTLYDLDERISSSYFSNKTGYIDLVLLKAGDYAISVQKANRTVGYQKISVWANETFLVKTWSYDLNMTLTGEDGEPFANHTVVVHDQMVFEASNYTIMPEDVRIDANYTVITDALGPSVARAETDENGTVSFPSLWNGTYRLGISGKEMWVTEYILGMPVLIRKEPAAGEHIIDLQQPANTTIRCTRLNFGLQFVSGSSVPVPNATVYIRNVLGHLVFKDRSNDTGFVEHRNVYVVDTVHTVSALYGYRLIGYKEINLTRSENFTVECYNNNLTITCVDQDRKPLPEHIVFLYDQVVFYSLTNITIVTNQTGSLLNLTTTDENGTVCFNDIWNGTYWVKVIGGEPVGQTIIDFQKLSSITIVCNKTFLSLGFVTLTGEPLPGANVLVSNSAGSLVFRGRTDEKGYIRREGMYIGNYTVQVEWMRTQVWSGTVDIYKARDYRMQCTIYRLTLRCVDTFGNSLPKANLKLERRRSPWETPLSLELETDEGGNVSLLLPRGIYDVAGSYGIFLGSEVINLDSDHLRAVRCGVSNVFWFSTVMVSLPLIIFTLLLERRRLRTPLEVRRYKSMLSKLEFMYRNGQVEYRIYRKLREEYEAKIMELGGREMR